jgi:hypothetical protein
VRPDPVQTDERRVPDGLEDVVEQHAAIIGRFALRAQRRRV